MLFMFCDLFLQITRHKHLFYSSKKHSFTNKLQLEFPLTILVNKYFVLHWYWENPAYSEFQIMYWNTMLPTKRFVRLIVITLSCRYVCVCVCVLTGIKLYLWL